MDGKLILAFAVGVCAAAGLFTWLPNMPQTTARKTRVLSIPTLILMVLILAFGTSGAYAQRKMEESDRWVFSLAPYLWAVDIKGDITAEGTTTPIDIPFDELFDQLEFAAQLHFEARKNKWGLIADSTFIKAKQDNTQVGPIPATAELEYILTDLLGTYRFAPKWDVLGGVRYWSMDSTITLRPGPAFNAKESWTDLIVGARFFTPLNEKNTWSFVGRADVGGFGISDSSDSTWSVSTIFGWNYGKNDSVIFGYRYLEVDRTTGTGPSLFRIDLRQQGPLVGINFTWPRKR